ncbi:hypothetical protein CEXT_414281 [Caerostris extrusa]|uniref:Uncharacterized protein n=1 Tax=Caerostris extrusa TaxID=172846 RepID=A0AAV4QNL2_CAEEX|nr:hypothetical protein CEXT_414281 [Caerostris extrusa]
MATLKGSAFNGTNGKLLLADEWKTEICPQFIVNHILNALERYAFEHKALNSCPTRWKGVNSQTKKPSGSNKSTKRLESFVAQHCVMDLNKTLIQTPTIC